MADETEVKFRVPSKTLDAVSRWRGLGICGSPKRQKLRSVYFDTPGGKLRTKGLTLRVRHCGKTRLQTVKSEGDKAFTRNEWECEIDGDLPDVSKLKNTPLAGLKRASLVPQFETVVTRTTLPVRMGTSLLEIALDRGILRASGRREAVAEIEIELKEGSRADLVRLARDLSRKIPAAYEARAKAERGFALADGEMAAESHARDLRLQAKMTAAEVFQAVGMECLRHIVANEAAVHAQNPEGIHQMRVGLRRLRAALSLFKVLLQDGESAAIKKELKWLTEQLGPAREFDVFMRDSVAPLEEAASEIRLLRQDLETRRDEGFEQARAAIGSERYRKLVLKTLFWLFDGAWSRADDDLLIAQRARCAADFVCETMDARLHKIIKRSRKLRHLHPHKRHKLRIAVKKLRYAGEFFASLFKAARKRTEMAETLEELQDALGRLNDIAVHRRMTKTIVQPPRRQQKAYAMGIVAGREQQGAAACLTLAHKAARRLAAEKPFWR
jgi:triphosphatase